MTTVFVTEGRGRPLEIPAAWLTGTWEVDWSTPQSAFVLERFWSRVRVLRSGCWKWQGPLGRSGHGGAGFRGIQGAHRVAFFLSRPTCPLPPMVCHRCHNGWCVRPDHLYGGNAYLNTQDLIASGKQSRGPRHSAAVLAGKARCAALRGE